MTRKQVTDEDLATMPTPHLSERYRPRVVSECVLLPNHRRALEGFIAERCAPHLLLVGPPGLGKTSVALALANDLNWEVIQKNADGYTNIEIVRTEIADFALPPHHSLLLLLGEEDRHRCVILDEADHIPRKAQVALGGIMDKALATNDSTFILTANDRKKIDPAITSRCVVFDLSYSDPADQETIKSAFRERAVKILKAEGREPNDDLISRCLSKYGLDFRAVLNELQTHR